MNHLGQSITWGTLSAPHLFTGKCTGYNFADAVTPQRFDDEVGDIVTTVRHSAKAAFSFSAEVTDGSTDGLDLSTGPIIAITGVSGGAACATQVVESWRLGQRKTVNVSGTYYPDITPGSGHSAGTTVDLFTPDQSDLSLISPAAVIIYGTYGITHSAGIVHELTVTQELRLVEDDVSPDLKIKGLTPVAYMRSIRLMLLATGAKPAPKTTLTLTGAPAHTADYTIDSSEVRFSHLTGKMYEINASWTPADS